MKTHRPNPNGKLKSCDSEFTGTCQWRHQVIRIIKLYSRSPRYIISPADPSIAHDPYKSFLVSEKLAMFVFSTSTQNLSEHLRSHVLGRRAGGGGGDLLTGASFLLWTRRVSLRILPLQFVFCSRE